MNNKEFYNFLKKLSKSNYKIISNEDILNYDKNILEKLKDSEMITDDNKINAKFEYYLRLFNQLSKEKSPKSKTAYTFLKGSFPEFQQFLDEDFPNLKN